MYDENLVAPMRKDLTSVGFKEMVTPDEVDAELKDFTGTALVVVNSVCGCAAGAARPGLKIALQNGAKPEKLLTVFAGQDRAATERARSYFLGYAPSSPAIAIFQGGKIKQLIERRDIEGCSAPQIAEKVQKALSGLSA